jgi:excisionase family DNA binding protein
MTAAEAAEYLRISLKALYARVERGQIRCYRFGRHLRFRRRDLDALMDPHDPTRVASGPVCVVGGE